MQSNFEFLEKPAQPVLSIRTRCAVEGLPGVIGQAYGKIMQVMGETGNSPVGAPFVAYYNMDMKDLDIEIGFPAANPSAGKGEVIQSEIPAGKQASCIYTGPYSKCDQAYAELTRQIAENGYEASGTAYEFYLNDPTNTPQEQLMTKIMFLLK
ncbi:MAG: GyrI-like domain-containing protein [Clostridiales bacterium]|nr:GyrI-like domain-containing protein [Clostridiales bacterium]